ncbi:MAG: DUF4465 domain-containing protein [Rikenellaceae bacterium]
MKKVFLLLSVAILAFSCNESEEVTPDDNTEDSTIYATLTFEDASYAASANYVGESSWSSLIDSPEYGGDLLYTDMYYDEYYYAYYCSSEYAWYDENNTELASEVIESWGSTAFWNGGIAVSNYYMAVSEDSQADYSNQLSVPVISGGNSGYNGSENFAVVVGGGYLYFGDGVARQIEEAYVALTSYSMSVILYGDGWNLTEGISETDWFKITATSVDSEGATIASTELYLAQGGEIVEGWNSWDLSSLGEVTKVVFSTDSSATNDWGSLLPDYFAIDNITVKME